MLSVNVLEYILQRAGPRQQDTLYSGLLVAHFAFLVRMRNGMDESIGLDTIH